MLPRMVFYARTRRRKGPFRDHCGNLRGRCGNGLDFVGIMSNETEGDRKVHISSIASTTCVYMVPQLSPYPDIKLARGGREGTTEKTGSAKTGRRKAPIQRRHPD
jgi:hypothetical protein